MSVKARFLLAAWGALLAAPALAGDQTPIVSGRDEFVWNCAECHGEDGRGSGPLAKALIMPPADLTQLSRNNLGVFPADKVFGMIAGREDTVGHQSLQMPKYWQRFEQSEGRRGFDAPEVRIRAIVEHLRSIQAP